MIVVAIVGILAALGIPVFRTFVLRSKTSEATVNLGAMFKNAAAYYTAERAAKGQTAAVTVGCTVDDVTPVQPTPQKQRFVAEPSFRALGFSVADYVYFTYGIQTEGGGGCGGQPNDATVYTLYAQGDLDGDTVTSLFELAVASDGNNELYHSTCIHAERELE
jgi:type II secretory pathway pseudopilin PulG